MKYLPLVGAALRRKPLRTAFTMLSIVTAFFLFGMLQGVNLGINSLFDFLNTERLRIDNRVGGMLMPVAYRQQIEAVPGVAAVTPLQALVGTWQQPRNVVVALGVDARAWFDIYPTFRAAPEQLAAMQRVRNGALAGVAVADKYGWRIGDRVPIETFNLKHGDGGSTWELEIVGTYTIDRAPAWATNVLVNFDYVDQARAEPRHTVDQFIARIAQPDRYAQVALAIDELFANSPNQSITRSEEDFVRTGLAQLGDINYLVNGIVGAVLFALLFLTTNTMALSIRERIPEFAALKTIGFTDRMVLLLVLGEVLALCLAAGLAGLGAAAATFPALMAALGPQVGLEGLRIPAAVYGYGAAIAVAVAVASGLPPAWRAMRLSIVDGLADR